MTRESGGRPSHSRTRDGTALLVKAGARRKPRAPVIEKVVFAELTELRPLPSLLYY
jgi:hypothetical protein